MFCLRMARLCLLTVCCAATLACTPLVRGFSNGDLVSNGFPPVTIACNLPVLTEGQCAPFILTEYGYETPSTWIAVYGEKNPASPLAIAAYSVTPDAMEWDSSATSFPDRPVTGQAEFGGHAFSGSTHILNAKNDPFAPLVYSPEELKKNGETIFWLAQRFTAMDLNFWHTKIILEYREPLPAWLPNGLGIESSLGAPEMAKFIERAKNAFTLAFDCQTADIPRAPYLQGVSQRYLERFIGSMNKNPDYNIPNDI